MADNLKWITLDNGTHIPIEKGQTKGEAIDYFVYRHRASMKPIRVNNETYSRLRKMFSDYRHGTCSTVKEFDNIKIFDLDNTKFIVVGEYPYLDIIGKKTYRSREKLDKAWEENK